jgi:hypothetical protein
VSTLSSIMDSEFVKIIKNDPHVVFDESFLIDLMENVVIKSEDSKHDYKVFYISVNGLSFRIVFFLSKKFEVFSKNGVRLFL